MHVRNEESVGGGLGTEASPGEDSAAGTDHPIPAVGAAGPKRLGGAGKRWRFSWINLLIALSLLAGLSLVCYPPVAAWVSQYNQSNLVFDQAKANSERAAEEIASMLAQAHEYNEALESGAMFEGGRRVAEGTGQTKSEFDYWKLLTPSPTGTMARLRVPSIDLDLPVYHGTSDETLLKGIGHLQGTSLPVGGPGTRSVLTGHRGLASAEMFTRLDEVKKGDTFSVEVLGEVFTYRVNQIDVVAPDATEEIRPVAGEDLMTLVTCTPLGINSHRILVTGKRVVPTPAADLERAGARPEVPGFPWWILIYSAGVAGIGVWYWRSGYEPVVARARRRRREARHSSGE
ncbi:class C sortase [Leucobacter sp. CSA2]|uniref:Class C sortase n=1 Tax=Leucobacter edaphi TaxID=2796472 RepID=A0A934UY47_9MICO|nr:class C sortase [Leucobacter edaphi]